MFGQHGAVDSPEEISLVLVLIDSPAKLAIDHASVMSGSYPPRVDSIRLFQEVAELRERVATDARNRRAAARILFDEVVDHIVPEAALEVEHVMRDPELLADATRVVHGIERAAGTVGDIFAVTEQLHCRADDVVALFDEQRRGDR